MLRPLAALVAVSLAACGSSPSEPAKATVVKTDTKTDTNTETKTETKPDLIADAAGPILDQEVETIDGVKQKLSDYRGKAVLLVNVASECGYTPQYAQLQELYGRYKDRGLVVLGFPSNDFGGQEPGDAAQIKEFVASKFAVDFPMMAKIHARGPEIAPLYKTLTEDTPESMKGEVQWNFTKFLVDPTGKVVARFESKIEPMAPEVTAAVEKVLPAKT